MSWIAALTAYCNRLGSAARARAAADAALRAALPEGTEPAEFILGLIDCIRAADGGTLYIDDAARPTATQFDLDHIGQIYARLDAVPLRVLSVELADRSPDSAVAHARHRARDDAATREALDTLAELHRHFSADRTLHQAEASIQAPGPRPRAPHVGDILNGWLLVEKLGAGGWGDVYRAENNGRVRAIKLMKPESPAADAAERFVREIKTLSRLPSHPNLVAYHEFYFNGQYQCLFYLMEFVDGASLHERLMGRDAENRWTGRPLYEAEAREVFGKLADGLAAAHDLGIVHRDVKPLNVMFRHDGTPVLVDFGLARRLVNDTLTAGGDSQFCTQAFAAPEQLEGQRAGKASDVYSLARTMYFALTVDEDWPARRRHHRERRFDEALVPPSLRSILRSALEDEVADRPADAAAFRDLLRATSVQVADAPRQVQVALPGRWFARPDDGDEPIDWGEMEARLPGTVTLRPGTQYRIEVLADVADRELAAVAALHGTPVLRSLDLNGCSRITDASLPAVGGLTGLRSLDLSGVTNVTDVGLFALAGLAAMRSLSLRGCLLVTDAGLEALGRLPGLRSLDLTGCSRLTELGLSRLHRLTRLERLELGYFKGLTPEGLAKLRGALPRCHISCRQAGR